MKFDKFILIITQLDYLINNLKCFNFFKIYELESIFLLVETLTGKKINYQKAINNNNSKGLIKDLETFKNNICQTYKTKNKLE